MRLYRYVGPKSIAERSRTAPGGTPIRTSDDVRDWVAATGQQLAGGEVVATFVIDASGVLLVADRRSEHVACAGGMPVRSAGEMTFVVGCTIEVVTVSNQSTGYCPEPASWQAVAEALTRIGFAAPAGFALACEFRRCKECGQLALVKGGMFECAACGAELPAEYNAQM